MLTQIAYLVRPFIAISLIGALVVSTAAVVTSTMKNLVRLARGRRWTHGSFCLCWYCQLGRFYSEYTVYDKDGFIVRSGPQLVREGAMCEIPYEEFSELPVGDYIVEPGSIKLEIRDSC